MSWGLKILLWISYFSNFPFPITFVYKMFDFWHFLFCSQAKEQCRHQCWMRCRMLRIRCNGPDNCTACQPWPTNNLVRYQDFFWLYQDLPISTGDKQLQHITDGPNPPFIADKGIGVGDEFKQPYHGATSIFQPQNGRTVGKKWFFIKMMVGGVV